jgi:gas vesicle protein
MAIHPKLQSFVQALGQALTQTASDAAKAAADSAVESVLDELQDKVKGVHERIAKARSTVKARRAPAKSQRSERPDREIINAEIVDDEPRH